MFSKPVPKLPEPTLPRSTSRCESPDAGRVKSKRESAECRAFRKCSSVLADGLTDPGWLAVRLYSRELIGPDLRTEAQKPAIGERVKTEMLLSAVEDQIVASPDPATKFREFLDVLQNEPSLQHLATRLENTYHELSGLCTPTSTPSSPHPQHPPLPPTNSSPPLPPAKRPRTDILQSLQHCVEHTIQQFDFQHNHQTPVLQYPSAQSTTPYNPAVQFSAVDTYASYLKSVYTREKLPFYNKWPQVISKKYINLALIENEDITESKADQEDITKPEEYQFTRATIHGNIYEIKKSKRAVDISQIAQLPDGSQPKCIFVEGERSIGEPIFAWKLCRKWGKGKLLQQYQLVVLLRLRDKSVQAAKNISDLFRYHDHQIQQAAVEEIQRTGGKGVLLLFEGYSEFQEEVCSESSVFLDVITGRELPEATVLITSRPWASDFLHRECKGRISQHIEILEFTEDNIESYLESTIPDDPSLLADLKKYISCYPHIKSLMYSPLNCVIVVEVYRNSRKDETLVPKTMTQLYSSLIRSLLLRHLLDHPVHGKNQRWRIRSFSDLPQDVYQQLCELGRIAYEGILHGQQVIFSDLPEDFETLGLMQCVPKLYVDEGTAVSYNFLHLTVQEYLAAFYLSQQPVEKQIEHLREYIKEEETYGLKQHPFYMVLQFLCGIRKFSGYPSDVLNTLSYRATDEYDDICFVVFDTGTLHFLFEAQDNDIIAKMLGSSNIYIFEDMSDQVTPFDCFVLGYCVAHINCSWRIKLADGFIGDEEIEMLVQGAMDEETHCTGGFSKINLSTNRITSGVKHLLKFPKQLMNNLQTLNLSYNKLDAESCVALAHLIPHMPHLKKLKLSNNPNISQGGAVPLMTSLTAHGSLEMLLLEETHIGVEDCRALSELLSSSKSLKKLDIGGNALPPEAIELIISGLHHNTTLNTLYMIHSHFSLQHTISLGSVLRTNHTLVDLNLKECRIDSDGACQLASALCTNDTLQELDLRYNPIGVEGATAFAEMLLKNKSLKELDLQHDSTGEVGAQKLINSLSHNTTLEKLWLSLRSSIASSRVDKRVSFFPQPLPLPSPL